MNPVKVSTEELVAKVTANLEAHKNDLVEANKGFQKMALKEIKNFQKLIKKGDFSNTYLSLEAPASHERDYQHALDMLEQHTEDNITLDSRSFSELWKNNWAWTDGYNSLSTLYKNYGVKNTRKPRKPKAENAGKPTKVKKADKPEEKEVKKAKKATAEKAE